MKRLLFGLTLLVQVMSFGSAWAAQEEGTIPPALLKNLCTQPAPAGDTEDIRNLIVQLTNYYNGAGSSSQLQDAAGKILDENITYLRYDLPGGVFKGQSNYFFHVGYDFAGMTAHNMGPVEDRAGGAVKVCVLNSNPNTTSADVKYTFTYTPKNKPEEKVYIRATWNFTRAEGRNPYNWVMSFANIYY
jgi:hypothetical protein